MTIKQLSICGPVDLDAYAEGEPVSFYQIRQLANATNAICADGFPIFSHIEPVAQSYSTINGRANDSEANWYNLIASNWHVMTRVWTLAYPAIPLRYPPGLTKATLKLKLATMTAATGVIRAMTGQEMQSAGEPNFRSTGLATLGANDDDLEVDLTIDLHPSGFDTLYLWHKMTEYGNEYTDARSGHIGSGGTNTALFETWFTDEQYNTMDIITTASGGTTNFWCASPETNTGANLADVGAIAVLKYNGSEIWSPKQCVSASGEVSIGGRAMARFLQIENPTANEVQKAARNASSNQFGWDVYETMIYSVKSISLVGYPGEAFE